MMNRRKLLKELLASAGSLRLSLYAVCRWGVSEGSNANFFQGENFLDAVPFSDEGNAPLNEPLRAELDGRLFTDLSKAKPENRVTRSEEFYVRTRASRLLDGARPWLIKMKGLDDELSSIPLPDLERRARPMGIHLMECAGNSRSAHFGMLSVADWEGVPVEEIIGNDGAEKTPTRILISGFDRYLSESRSSVPGASWIFTRDELLSSHAFLAAKMNGQALTLDHGAPVRLVVPGWYGCACIKWVNEIAFVPDDMGATSQMQEYAGRTNQEGVPALAKEFRPATITYGALPIRMEKWSSGEKLQYRVLGIHWGGTRPIEGLEIRLRQGQDFVPVEGFERAKDDSWGFWSHSWMPPKPGKYAIRLRLKDRNIAARRLDSGYYERFVQIS